jgi:hypothetical protein
VYNAKMLNKKIGAKLEMKPHPLEGKYLVIRYVDRYENRPDTDIPFLIKVTNGEYIAITDLDSLAMSDYENGLMDFAYRLKELRITEIYFIKPKEKDSIFSELLGGGDYDNRAGSAGFLVTNSIRDEDARFPELPENFKIFSYNEKNGRKKEVNEWI